MVHIQCPLSQVLSNPSYILRVQSKNILLFDALMSFRKSKVCKTANFHCPKKTINPIFPKSADIQLDALAKGRRNHEWLNLSILIR